MHYKVKLQLEALEQCVPPPRHVLPVSRYRPDSDAYRKVANRQTDKQVHQWRLMQVAAWHRGCKTTSGRHTTTFGLTTTANTAVWTRRSTIGKPHGPQKRTPGDLLSRVFTSRWTGSSILVVGRRPAALCACLLATTQCNTRITDKNRPPTAVSGQTGSRNMAENT